MTVQSRHLFLSACVTILISLPASAQSLAGSVRDTSGAVLPGVTVEAASPVLIEKIRTAVSDGNGQYQIANLPPGSYRITFSLAGFATVVREGVNLTGSGVTTINSELRVGALEESITVTGETPVVDVQSARQTTVINGDVVRELPASRSYGNYLAAIPAIQATGFNTGVQTSNNFFTARGGRSNEGAIQIEGLIVGSPFNGGGVSNYLYDMNNAAEVQVSISGGLGESDRGAPIFNIIPKTGGNMFSGNYFGSFAGQWGQSSNIDDSLRALGFADAPALRKNWDNNISVGGPIKKDKLWFFANWRTIGSHIDTQNLYANKNAGNPNEWRWVRDESVRVRNASARMVSSIRLTSQVTPRNKVGFFIDYTKNCTGSSFTKDADQCRTPGDDWTASGPGIGPGVATTSPESGTVWQAPLKIAQATWNSPITNRVLFEAGASSFWVQWGDVKPGGALSDFISVTEQSTNAGVPMANYTYRGWYAQPSQDQQHATWRATLAYVSGSHNLKVGYQGGWMVAKTTTQVGQQINYIFNNGSPIQLQQRVGPTRVSDRLGYSAFYVQDAWTRGRLSLQGALRFETASSFSPDGENGVIADHRFGSALIFPRVEGVKGYRDITPRMGAAYDVFGNGRTALKLHTGQYLPECVLRRGVHNQQSGDDAGVHRQPPVDRPQRQPCGRVRFPEPGGQRRMRAVGQPAVGLCGADDDGQSRRPRRMGCAEPRLAAGRERAAAAGPAGGAGGQLQPALVEQLLHHPQHGADGRGLRRGDAHRAAAPAAARRGRLPGDVPGSQQPDRCGRREPAVLHPQPGLRRRDALLARRGHVAQRAPARDTLRAGRHQHRPRRQRHLRRAHGTVRSADGSDPGNRHRPGHRRRAAELRLHRAMADAGARPGQLHRTKGRRPGQHHLPLAAERPARSHDGGDQRRVANRQLPDDASAVPDSDRDGAATRAGPAERGSVGAWRRSTASASTSSTCGSPRCCGSGARA